MSAADLRAQADKLDAEATALREQASALRQAELAAKPLNERLVYAAYARCACGAGMAYDPAGIVGGGDSPLRKPNQWERSDVLRYTHDLTDLEKVAARTAVHDRPLSFAFYEVKSEGQPSANGATTRERVKDAA